MGLRADHLSHARQSIMDLAAEQILEEVDSDFNEFFMGAF